MASYKITIDTRGQTKKEKQQSKLEQVVNTNSNNDDSQEDKLNKLRQNEAVKLTIEAARTASNIALNYATTVGIRTDNQSRQNEINNIVNGANIVVSNVSNIAGSVATGVAVGGPAGIAMAAVEIALNLANQAYSMYQNILQLNRERTEDTLNASHAAERLGITCTDKNR